MNINESILISILIILIYIFFFKNEVELMKVDVNGEKVLVRKTKDYKESATLLAGLITRMYLLRDYLSSNKNIPEYSEFKKYIELLEKNFNRKKTVIYENNLNSNLTSYNVNKGEQLVFCLRCKTSSSLHNINLLVYVAVHEMAHSACPEQGHTPLFNKIFHFMLNEAVKINIYVYENYSVSPVFYCGMKLNTNILN
jgi:predicted metal-dependent hydrolase